jgi:hypothetical protein
VAFVAEILDRLVVEQAVHCLGLRLAVRLVHYAAEAHAPVREDQRKAHIGGDRDEGDEREAPIEHRPQNAGHHQHLEDRGHDVEHGEAQHRLDPGGPALQRARQPAGLTVQMKAQGELVQVNECLEADLADRALLDCREHRVPQFAEPSRGDAQQSICADQRSRDRDQAAGLRRQRIHGPSIDDRDVDRGDLREHQKQHGDDDAHPCFGLAFRPEIGEQRTNRLQAGSLRTI